MPRQSSEARETGWVACASACVIVLGLLVAVLWETPAGANNLDRVQLGLARTMAALKGGKPNGPNADEVVAALAKYTAINDASLFRRIIPSTANPNGTVNMAGLRQDLAFFEEEGLIQKPDPVNLDSVVDDSFAKAAIASPGASIGRTEGK